MNCNDVKTYIREKARMCIGRECKNCPLEPRSAKDCRTCMEVQFKYPERALEIVQKWSDEHPVKTRMSVFLEAFPNAVLFDEGYPQTCARNVFGESINCGTECEECWHTLMEEDNE